MRIMITLDNSYRIATYQLNVVVMKTDDEEIDSELIEAIVGELIG